MIHTGFNITSWGLGALRMITDNFTHSLSQKCTKSFLLGISIYSLHSKIVDILSLDKKLEVEKCGAQKKQER